MSRGWQAASRKSQGGRPYQEDDCAIVHVRDGQGRDAVLAVLADGMGGHAGGAVASGVATRSFVETYRGSDAATSERLEAALSAANDSIAARADREPGLQGMGCTLVGLLAAGERLDWISVGDSPLWLFADGVLRRLNEDHSMTPLLKARVERGEMTANAAAMHPSRNALRSAVVGEDIPLVDLAFMPLQARPGDIVLLASDGLCSLDDGEILEILRRHRDGGAEAIAEELISAVDTLGRSDQDNTTVVVLQAGR
ncbi:MAG: PP2C family serine/threonine-protein phosphatase [Reyranellaceae bacterium]